MNKQFEPKIFVTFKEGYRKKDFFSDLMSGIIVGIVALPLAIAFAIASGVKPEQGIFTAIIAGFTASLFGGSRVQISGPTGAFIIIIYGIVQKYGYDGLAVATFLAGIILIFMGFLRFGSLLKYVPYPLIVGFTSGIAVIIFSSQIKDFLGIVKGDLPIGFVDKIAYYINNSGQLNINALIIGLSTIFIILTWNKLTHKIPGALVAIIVITCITKYFNIQVETIGSRFGEVPNSLPMPRLPNITLSTLTNVFSPALTIAMLAGIESLLSAVVADGMMRTRHRSNMELIAQGFSNILSPIFLGIPSTGAIARTATNIRNGGLTPVSGLIHSLVILLILFLFAKLASLIPLPIFAGILIVISYNMSEWRSFKKILQGSKTDIIVMSLTFLLTIFIDLTAAIEVGVISSALLFIRRMTEVSQINVLNRELFDDRESEEKTIRYDLPKEIVVFEIYGTLFFGAVEKFTDSMKSIDAKIKIFIAEISNLLFIDSTGLKALEELIGYLKKNDIEFILSGLHKQPLFALHQSGIINQINEEYLCGNLEEAINLGKSIMKK